MMKLNKGELFRMAKSSGATLTAHEGKVWITQQDDPRDVFLAAGQSFTFNRTGLALVEAVRDSIVSLDS